MATQEQHIKTIEEFPTLQDIPDFVISAHGLLESSFHQYNIDYPRKRINRLWVLVSGGDDSLATLAIAKDHPKFDGIIHVHTMTNPITKENTNFVRNLATQLGCGYIEETPATTAEMLWVKYGFPGSTRTAHSQMYRMLKERPLLQAKKKAKKISNGRVGFVTGIRQDESVVRMGYSQSLVSNHVGAWIAPILKMSKSQATETRKLFHMPENPLTGKIKGNKDCWCGSFASAGEKEGAIIHKPAMRQWFSHMEGIVTNAYEYQKWAFEQGLADKIRIPHEATRWGWGAGQKYVEQTQMLWDEKTDMMLCSSCETKTAPSMQDIDDWMVK